MHEVFFHSVFKIYNQQLHMFSPSEEIAMYNIIVDTEFNWLVLLC